MAGAGWRDFIPGEVLTAANVQDYLQDQAVMAFASVAARTSAIASPTEGMVSFLKDSNLFEVYDGSAWKQFAKTTDGIIGVSTVTKTDTWSGSIAAGAAADVTDLSIAYTAKSTGSKLLLIANLGIVADSSGLNASGLRFVADSTAIGVGATAGSRTSVSAGMQNSPSTSTSISKSLSMQYVYTPVSTSAITYKVQIVNSLTGTQTHYVNRGNADTDNAANGRSISTFTIMEIAG